MVVVSTNFPFLDEIIPILQQADPTGRTVSRFEEMMAGGSFEIVFEGEDYRIKKAQKPAQVEAGRISLATVAKGVLGSPVASDTPAPLPAPELRDS